MHTNNAIHVALIFLWLKLGNVTTCFDVSVVGA